MSSKEEIIRSLREASPERFPKPDLTALKAGSLRYDDLLGQFRKAVESTGGRTVILSPEQDSYKVARDLFPDEDSLVVAEGVFGVAENGCVYLEEPKGFSRKEYFLVETLVIVIGLGDIVANMHDAYDRLGETTHGYGIFISGPSKTADIEQALVFGAHGARQVAILLKP
jgi:L-lactate dehydrogenase complex protein LldG